MTKTGHIILWGWINALLTILVINALNLLFNGYLDKIIAEISVAIAVFAYMVAGMIAAEDDYGK